MEEELVVWPVGEGDLVELALVKGCIETTARRGHRLLTDRCLAGEMDPVLVQAVELLGAFIESADFAELRARNPQLACSSGVRVRLQRGPKGIVVLT